MVEAGEIVVTEGEEKIIYKKSDETEKETSCEINYETFDNFMLEKPEPLKKGIKFTVHNLGAIKGTMRRTEIYEDR